MTLQTTDRIVKPLVIECFYYPGCLSHRVLPERLTRALEEVGVQAEVHHLVLSVEEGQAHGMGGSPTVRINGRDILEMPGAGGT